MAKERIVPRLNKWYGYRRDIRDARDHLYLPPHITLPAAVDLRPHCPPVMNQGDLGSCTAHGITGALRYCLISKGKPDVPLSRLQLYYDERAVEGSINDDAGAEIRDGIKCANKLGVAHEKLWPYVVRKFKAKPPAAAYTDAVQFQAMTYQRVAVSALAVKSALAQGFPVVIGFSVYDSFESPSAAKTGIIPMPNLKREQLLGGHCVYAVGYGQHAGYITCRNSWDTDWGDKGDFYLPEAFVGSTNFGGDYWTIQTVG